MNTDPTVQNDDHVEVLLEDLFVEELRPSPMLPEHATAGMKLRHSRFGGRVLLGIGIGLMVGIGIAGISLAFRRGFDPRWGRRAWALT
jgi:hypothetical protein